MEKTKLLTIAVIALLMLNLGTLAFLVLHRPHGGMSPNENHEKGPADFIIRELEFNENQKVQFMKLVDAHRKSMNDLKKIDAGNYDKLIDALGINDTVFVNTTLHVIGNTKAEGAKITLKHFEDVSAICTAEQKNKFKSVIHEVLRMMAPPQRH